MLKKNDWKQVLLPIFIMVLTACGGGGGGDDGGGGDATVDVTGQWSITETMGSNTCGDTVGAFWQYTFSAVQNGNSLTLTTDSNETFTGTVSGDNIVWTGSYPDNGGTTSVTGTSITVSADGQSMSGSASWTWSDGTESCSGTTSVEGVCLGTCGGTAGGDEPVGGDEPIGGSTADFSGTWFGAVENPGGIMAGVTMVISGTLITSISAEGSDLGLTGTISDEGNGIYSIVLSDTTYGGLFVDSAGEHMVYVDEDTNFGVLEKGAISMGGFVQTDIDGDWSGIDVEIDLMTTFTAQDIVARFQPDGDFSIGYLGYSGFSGSVDVVAGLGLDDVSYGSYYGAWMYATSGGAFADVSAVQVDEEAGGGEVAILLSPDKQFAGAYACNADFIDFFSSCNFSAWSKQ